MSNADPRIKRSPIKTIETSMETLLFNCVEKNLNHFTFNNAIFLSERLCAQFPSEVNSQLLARCYLSNNQPHCAYYILKGLKAAQSRYLFAISCFKLDRLSEAEAALLPTDDDCEVPNGAAGHYILGLVYRYTARRKSSIEHLRKALEFDPLFWEAYGELCKLGAAEDAGAVFGEEALQRIQELYFGQASTNSQTSSGNQVSDPDRTLEDLKHSQANEQQDTSNNHHGEAVLSGSIMQLRNSAQTNVLGCNTPSPAPSQPSDIAPPPPRRNAYASGVEGSLVSIPGVRRRKLVGEEKSVEASVRLFSESGLRRSARLAARRKMISQASGNGANCLLASSSESNSTHSLSSMIDRGQRESSEEASSSGLSLCATVRFSGDETSSKSVELTTDHSAVNSAITDTLNLLRVLGEGHRLLCTYKCQDALLAYQKLPQKQYNTWWVLSQVGKAYFELLDYLKANSVYTLARQISPYVLEGLDIHSTVLYHLKEDMKLSYLAEELISIDRLAPESWCAVGNCYSLRKDHETALKVFQRAMQLNTRFTYAHTLCGHEYAAIEEYEDAEKCYQRALNIDTRHYNAWYGLGMIYLRQEKYEFAEHHFRQAHQINPHSSVIMCYIGIALHQLKRNNEALEMLENAIITDTRNPLPKYYKATALVSFGAYDKAAEVLEELKDYAPRESSIHALLGKVYKQLELHDKAMLHFGIALDLHPSASDAAHIKVCMEKLLIPDEMEDDV